MGYLNWDRLGITSGWEPVFLLMRTVRSLGSSETLGKSVIKIEVPIYITHRTKNMGNFW
jgi:hypothetical protein